MSIKVNPPVRIPYWTDPPLVLSPGETGSVMIVLAKEDVQSFKGILAIATAQYSQKIPLESAPTPPRIQIELPDPSMNYIDFGDAIPGDTISRTFMIKNSGGMGSIIGMGILPPFHIAKNQEWSKPKV